jgi:hypothetical protein
VDCVALVCS